MSVNCEEFICPELQLDYCQLEDVLSAVVHTILFTRCLSPSVALKPKLLYSKYGGIYIHIYMYLSLCMCNK